MKLYIKALSSYKGDITDFDVKKELKQNYKYDTRRQDNFILLSLWGALKLKDKIKINKSDELYITSGIGNIDILNKINKAINIDNDYLKPVDFINLLGNTSCYYIACALGLNGKNTFQISNNFTFINNLISIYASMINSKNDAILGSIDLASEPMDIIRRISGLAKNTDILTAVNYQKLSLSKENAIASIEFSTRIYNKSEIETIINKSKVKIVTHKNVYFETMPSYYVNQAINLKENIIYIDSYKENYKSIFIEILS